MKLKAAINNLINKAEINDPQPQTTEPVIPENQPDSEVVVQQVAEQHQAVEEPVPAVAMVEPAVDPYQIQSIAEHSIVKDITDDAIAAMSIDDINNNWQAIERHLGQQGPMHTAFGLT